MDLLREMGRLAGRNLLHSESIAYHATAAACSLWNAYTLGMVPGLAHLADAAVLESERVDCRVKASIATL